MSSALQLHVDPAKREAAGAGTLVVHKELAKARAFDKALRMPLTARRGTRATR